MSTKHHTFPCLKVVCRKERAENLWITNVLFVFVLSRVSESSILVLTFNYLSLRDLPWNVWFHNQSSTFLTWERRVTRVTILLPK